MERIIPTSMTGTMNATYEDGLTSIVSYITNTKGAYAIIDPHNFGRYYGIIITDDAGFTRSGLLLHVFSPTTTRSSSTVTMSHMIWALLAW